MTSPPTPPADASEEAARSPQEALAAPIRLEGVAPRPSARPRLAAFLVALAGHAAVLYALTRQPLDLSAGAGGNVVAAVNVTMVSAGALESRDDQRAPPVSAAVEAVEARDGALEGKRRPKPAEREKEAEAKEVQKEAVKDDAVVEAPPKSEEPPREREEDRQEVGAAAERVGGASARGEARSAAALSAAAAARAGAVRAYANAVAAALAKVKPRRVPAYGKVEVNLLVSVDGGVASIDIVKSSGNRRLDSVVLRAVRRAKLPVPPPGLSPDERWYEFIYEFSR